MTASQVLFEGEKGQVVPYGLATHLKDLNVCDAGLGPGGLAVLSNFRKVGVLTYQGQLVEIRPKVSVQKVLTLLDPHLKSFIGLDDEAALAETADWTNALALFFDYQLNLALARGAKEGYVAITEWSRTLRGRLEFSLLATAGRFGTAEVPVTHDEFTADIIENQMLLTAIEVLLSTRSLSPQRRSSLQRHTEKLHDVSLLETWGKLPEVKLSSSFKHYEPALKTAILILNSQSVESLAGSIRTNSFLIDMSQLFEFLVERKFAEFSSRSATEFRAQFGSKHLDLNGVFRIRPDFMFFEGQRPVGLADAKYKQVFSESDVATSDINQIIAYCSRFNLQSGHLIFAGAPEFSAEMVGSGIKIWIHELDLSLSSEEIEEKLFSIWNQICKPADFDNLGQLTD